ncbi:hypothetical protein L1887_01076 [Cichorium endivia]|nr:hypothetical protein L1887_01076 [Cichorium endivia]
MSDVHMDILIISKIRGYSINFKTLKDVIYETEDDYHSRRTARDLQVTITDPSPVRLSGGSTTAQPVLAANYSTFLSPPELIADYLLSRAQKRGIMNMNHNQQSNEVKHDDETALTDFLASLTDYTPTIPDELVEHYLAKSGFQCPDVRLIRLVAVATQKFVSEVATEALQQCKARPAPVVRDKKDKQQKDKRLIMNMDDLSKALQEYGINAKHQEYFADSSSAGMESAQRDE